jgi:hypothetical protein
METAFMFIGNKEIYDYHSGAILDKNFAGIVRVFGDGMGIHGTKFKTEINNEGDRSCVVVI